MHALNPLTSQFALSGVSSCLNSCFFINIGEKLHNDREFQNYRILHILISNLDNSNPLIIERNNMKHEKERRKN